LIYLSLQKVQKGFYSSKDFFRVKLDVIFVDQKV
jgi:hypothetical protein